MAEIDLEIGSSGLNAWAGMVQEELLRQLASPERRNRTYREMMDNDPVVNATLYTADMLLRQTTWRVDPFIDAPGREPLPADIAAKEFVDSCFEDLNRPWKEVASEAFSFVPLGWSWQEIVLKRRHGPQNSTRLIVDGANVLSIETTGTGLPSSKFNDGKIGWHKISGRSQDTLFRWQFDEHGDMQGLVQQAPPDYTLRPISLAKSMHFRTSAMKNNPEGRAVLRGAFRPWYFKKTIEEVQAVGIERDLAGLPVLWVPPRLMREKSQLNAADLSLRDTLEQVVRNIRRGQQEGLLLPIGSSEDIFKLELLASTGRRQFNTTKIMEYYDQRIAMMMIADFILLGHEAVGSFALADSKTTTFGMAMGTYLDVIADQYNRRAIPQLLRLNNMDEERPPKLVHEDVETVDLKDLGEYIGKLSGAGVELFPNKELEDYLLAQAGLPAAAREL